MEKNIENKIDWFEDIKESLKLNKQTQINNICDSFGFSNIEKENLMRLDSDLSMFWLNIEKQLLWYNKYITKNLSKLHPNIQNKIKKSIKLKVLWLSNNITEFVSWDNNDINNKWIINEKIQNSLWFIGNELLPSALVYQNRYKIDWGVFDWTKKIEELKEMFEAKVDENWDFDEWLFSTQIIFDYEWTGYEQKFLEKNNIEKAAWINMLSEKDKQMEWDIMIKYLAFVWTMLIPYAWAATSVPSDYKDLFTSEEWVLDTMKSYNILSWDELNYKMEKHWFDTVFWFIGLVWTAFWAQAVSKWWKFTKVITKLESLWIKWEYITRRISEQQLVIKNQLFKWQEITKQWAKKIFEWVSKAKENILNSNLVTSIIWLSRKAESKDDITEVKTWLIKLLDSIPSTKSKELMDTMFPEIRDVLNSKFPWIVFNKEWKALMTDREFIKWWIENPIAIFDSHLPIWRQMEVYLKLMKDLPEANKLKRTDLAKQEAEQLLTWEKDAEAAWYITKWSVDKLKKLSTNFKSFRKMMWKNRLNPTPELEASIKQWEKNNDYNKIQEEIKSLTDKINIGRTDYVKNNILNDIQWDDVSTFFTDKTFNKNNKAEINNYTKSLDSKWIKYNINKKWENISIIVESERYSFWVWKLLCAYKDDSGWKWCRYCWLSALNKIAWEWAIPELQKQAIIKWLDKVASNPKINIVELLNDWSYFNKTEFPEELQKLVMQKVSDTPHVLSVAVETRPEYFDVLEVKNALSILREDQKLNIYFWLETLDNFVNGPLNNKWYWYIEFEKQIEKLAKWLTDEEKSRVSVSAYNFMKPAYLTEEEAINATIEMTRKIKELEAKTGIQMYIKMEPPVITWGTIQKLNYDKIIDGERQYDVMNYYSVAEIIARMSLENLHESIIVWWRADMDPMTITSMIRNIKDQSRFSQFDAIVYNAVQRFNQTRDPKNFLEDIYFGIKWSEEFVDWEKKLYWSNWWSWLAKLMKMVDEKGIFEWKTKRKEFVDNMWKWFDQIEYTDTRLTDILRKNWEQWIERARKRVERILKKHNLELDTTIWSNIQFHYIDNWITGKDNLLKSDDLNPKFWEVTEKAWYNIQLTLRDEDWAPYIGWLFVPLKHDWVKKHMESPFSEKIEPPIKKISEINKEETKIHLVKGLIKDEKLKPKLISEITHWVKLEDIQKVNNEWIPITNRMLSMFSNIINNWSLHRTNFYDFMKNFPKDLWKKQDMFEANKYKDSIIYQNKFENVPSHYVSVFHYTSWKYIEDIIAKWWVKPLDTLWKDDIYYQAIRSKEMSSLDKIFDRIAPDWFSRTNSVYWYSQKQNWSTMWNGNVCLELKVDPNKVLVANAEYYTEANIKWPEWWDKEYRNTAITLTEYNKLSEEDRMYMFTFPEVIIPNWVWLDHISIN